MPLRSERRSYNLRSLFKAKRVKGTYPRMNFRALEDVLAEARTRLSRKRNPHVKKEMEDKMVQTLNDEGTGSGESVPSSVAMVNVSEPKNPDMLPDLTEGDISTLLGMIDVGVGPEGSGSFSGGSRMVQAKGSTPAPGMCSSPMHCMACPCQQQAASWCSSHSHLCSEVSLAGYRQSSLVYPPAFCTGTCMCMRTSPCSLSKLHMPVE